jgi:hypothetical protein
MSTQKLSVLADSLSEQRIRELLLPLKQESTATDYLHQYKAVKEFSQRLRALETLFDDVYTVTAALEQEILKQKNDDMLSL